MTSSSNSTPSSCALMLTTPPEERCAALPSVSSSSSRPPLESPPYTTSELNGRAKASEGDASGASSRLSLPAFEYQMPDLLPNNEMNGMHGLHHHSTSGRKEDSHRRRPPSPLKGFEAYSNQPFLPSDSSTSTPGSHMSATAPVTPHAFAFGSQWPIAEYNPATSFSPFGDDHLMYSDSARKVHNQTTAVSTAFEPAIGHHLIITDIPTSVTKEEIQVFISDLTPYRAILVRHLETHGIVILCFFDSRDALKVHKKLHVSSVRFNQTLGPVTLQCSPISREMVRKLEGGAEDFFEKVWKDSNPTVLASVNGPVSAAGIRTIFGRIGDLRDFKVDPNGMIISADYFDARAAAQAVQILGGARIGGFKLTIMATAEDGDPFDSRPLTASTSPQVSGNRGYTFGSATYGNSSRHQSSLKAQSAQRTEASRAPQDALRTSSRHPRSFSNSFEYAHTQPLNPNVQSALPRNHSVSAGAGDWARLTQVNNHVEHRSQAQTSRLSDPFVLQTMLDQMGLTAREFQTSAKSVPPHNPQAIPVENMIHRDRIISGLDKRTTVMIKDVPNKLSREELINILKEVVPNEFDFVYLRFDFTNHCNVGYAFVNFTSIHALLHFVDCKAGRKWNLFASEKVLQVSYANIQGKSSLIMKFKNSHVMDALEEWRPQIFYSDGAMKGQPEPFPEADHLARNNLRGSFSRPPYMLTSAANGGGSSCAGYDLYRSAV